jgi:hypothetical protein
MLGYTYNKCFPSFFVSVAFFILVLNSFSFSGVLSCNKSVLRIGFDTCSMAHSTCGTPYYVEGNQICCNTLDDIQGGCATFEGDFVGATWTKTSSPGALECINSIPQGTFEHCVPDGEYTQSYSWVITFYSAGENNPPTPSCSTPTPVSEPRCKGGQGLWAAGKSLLDIGYEKGYNVQDHLWAYPTTIPTELTRPDGSLCKTPYTGEPCNPDWYVCETEAYREAIVCPLGFEDPEQTCEENPNQPNCQENNSSSSGGCKVMVDGICMDEPDSGCEVMIDGVCVDNGDGDSSGSGGVDCSDINNCDWAKVDVQLEELGVAMEIRNRISELGDLARNHYNLTQEQNNLLDGVISAINNGNSNVAGAVGNSTLNITGAIDRNGNEIVEAINSLSSKLGNGTGTIPGVSSGSGDGDYGFTFCDPTKTDCPTNIVGAGDTSWGMSGADFGKYKKSVGLDEGSFGSSVDSLVRDTSIVFNSMRSAVEPLTQCFYGYSGNSSVIDLGFTTYLGEREVTCSEGCKIDLKNFAGVDVAEIFNTLITFLLVITSCVRIIRVAKTFGQTG